MTIPEGSPAYPCKTCWYWKQQKGNKNMGHCMFQLPGSVSEIVGSAAMTNGIYLWIESIGRCYQYRPHASTSTVEQK